MKKTSVKINTKRLNAMMKALGEVGTFDFDADYESYTVVVKHKEKGEVLRGVKVKDNDLWIVSHVEDLFIKGDK